MQSTLNEDLETIKRYFDLNLTLKELEVFERRLNEEKGFQEKVEQYEASRHLLEGIFIKERLEERAKLEDRLSKLHSTNTDNSTDSTNEGAKVRQINYRNYIIGIAASIALLVAAFALLQNTSKESPEQMAQRFKSEMNIDLSITQRSEGEVDANAVLFEQAEQEFKQRNYSTSNTILKSISDNNLSSILLLRGLNEIGLEHYDNGIVILQQVIDLGGDKKDIALWHQALAYVQVGKQKEAIEKLDIIINESYPQINKAKELKKLLE